MLSKKIEQGARRLSKSRRPVRFYYDEATGSMSSEMHPRESIRQRFWIVEHDLLLSDSTEAAVCSEGTP